MPCGDINYLPPEIRFLTSTRLCGPAFRIRDDQLNSEYNKTRSPEFRLSDQECKQMKAKRNKPIKIAITNIYAAGCYTAPVYVGSRKTPVNVFLDTGSSSLAVNRARYDPAKDRFMTPTNLAQYVTYLDGSGWKGAVVRTRIAVRHFKEKRRLNNVNVSVVDEQKDMFDGEMQGILGLAYVGLNDAYKYKKPTWPSFNHKTIDKKPVIDIEPYFTQLEESGTTANKFAFYTLRSEIRYGSKNIATDPWNKGYLVLGGGEEYTSLYKGRFKEAIVQHDVYYNTNMTSLRVGASKPIPIPPSSKESGLNSNSIVDNGTDTISFPTWLYKKMLRQFRALNPDFARTINRSVNYDDVKLSDSAIRKWPKIYVTMQGTSGDIELTIRPQTYWQTDYTEDRVTGFAIDFEEDDQTILGLPFMNNYYCIFDRSADDGLGVIRFASPKLPKK